MTPIDSLVNFVQSNYMGVLLSVFVIYTLYLRWQLVRAEKTLAQLSRMARELRAEVAHLMNDISQRR